MKGMHVQLMSPRTHRISVNAGKMNIHSKNKQTNKHIRVVTVGMRRGIQLKNAHHSVFSRCFENSPLIRNPVQLKKRNSNCTNEAIVTTQNAYIITVASGF